MEMMLSEYSEDRAAGRTMGALHGKVDALDQKVDTHIIDYERRVTTLEAGAKRDAEDRAWGREGTGRFQIPPTPTPPHGVVVQVGAQHEEPHSRSRHSTPPWLESALRSAIRALAKHWATAALAGLVAGGGYHLLGAHERAGGAATTAVPVPVPVLVTAPSAPPAEEVPAALVHSDAGPRHRDAGP